MLYKLVSKRSGAAAVGTKTVGGAAEAVAEIASTVRITTTKRSNTFFFTILVLLIRSFAGKTKGSRLPLPGNPAARSTSWADGFASPPYDGFASIG